MNGFRCLLKYYTGCYQLTAQSAAVNMAACLQQIPKMWCMKKIVLTGVMMCCFVLHGLAQQRVTTAKKQVVGKKAKTVQKDSSVALVSTTSYKAFSPAADNSLRISDPTINSFNQRAAGADIRISGSGIANMPKGSYGFANGKILLRNTTATTPGTGYGSGAVGTGTAIQGAGTGESSVGVNGKSPYAGPWLWGDRKPVYSGADSSTKKQ